MSGIAATSPKETRKARERIDVRLRPDQKTSIERAAGIRGLSVTDFIIQNAVENATRTIREYETWTLERADAELFFTTLLQPPAPGPRLMRSAERYKERYLHGE